MATKSFITDEEMMKLENAGKASYPSFIPDEQADSFFGIQPEIPEQKSPGLFQSVAQSIAKPFLKAGQTFAALPAYQYARSIGLPHEEAMRVATEEQDFGYFGKGAYPKTGKEAFFTGVELGTNLPLTGGAIKAAGAGLLKGTIKPALKEGVKLAPLGAAGAAARAQQEGSTPGQTAASAALGGAATVVGAPVLGLAGKGLASTTRFVTQPVKTVGRTLESVGQKIQQTVFRPMDRDVKDGFKIENVFKHDVGGNLQDGFTKVEQRLQDLTAKLYQRVKGTQANVDLFDVALKTEKSLGAQKGRTFGEAGRMNRILEELRQEVVNVSPKGRVDLGLAQEVKQAAGAKGAWEYRRVDPDASASEKVYSRFYSILKDEIKKVSPKGYDDINQQISELIPIKNAIIRRIPVDARNQAISLSDTIAIAGAIANPKISGLYFAQKVLKSGKVGEALGKTGRQLLGKKGAASIPDYTPPQPAGLLGSGPIVPPYRDTSGIVPGAAEAYELQRQFRPLSQTLLPPNRSIQLPSSGVLEGQAKLRTPYNRIAQDSSGLQPQSPRFAENRMLPAPQANRSILNQGRPIPVFPKQTSAEFTGKDISVGKYNPPKKKELGKPPTQAYGGFAGFQEEQDESGKKRLTFRPEYALGGILGAKALGSKSAQHLTTKFLEYAKNKTTLSKQEIMDFSRRPELKKGEADLLLKKLEEFEPKEEILYHGTSSKTQDTFTNKEPIYLTNSKKAAKIYEGKENSIISRSKGGSPRTLEIVPSPGKTTVMSSKNNDILDAIYYGDTDYLKESRLNKYLDISFGDFIKKEIEKAKNSGARYYEFNHPDGPEGEAYKTRISLYPRDDLKVSSDKIPAKDFADSIRRDLLELKPVKIKPNYYRRFGEGGYPDVPASYPFENIRIKEGNPKNYEEVVFESPITTNGSSHYPNSKNYFAHARGDEVVEGGKRVWREQEIQSDLLQKDNLEKMKGDVFRHALNDDESFSAISRRIGEGNEMLGNQRMYELNKKELAPLDSFTNDRFGERIMRERIKEKASKGYEKYRLPTGETIGKIEGFDTTPAWAFERSKGNLWNAPRATPEGLKVGKNIVNSRDGSDWIITDILGDGRFKALPKKQHDSLIKEADDGWTKKELYDQISQLAETFDLTGKSNPQYRRYEQWSKFLKNKYGGNLVTDPQGNTWMEIDIKSEYERMPIEAFGIAPLFGLPKQKEEKRSLKGRKTPR